jgi:hypothetical protein
MVLRLKKNHTEPSTEILRDVSQLFRMVYFPVKIMLNGLNEINSFLPNMAGFISRNGLNDLVINRLPKFESLVKIF